ncbi:MAG TPA: DUF2760 domain-containing protein [Pirellulaceae bacterium]|jgi:hypothetical protein|nr:DUF2760 domain-containing protein [Pirellulaceae bacterium]
MKLGLAFKAFFKILGDGAFAERVESAYEGKNLPAVEAKPAAPDEPAKAATKPAPVPIQSTQSEAIALLAALQRESRLVDLVMQPLDGYDDAQIGAAARDVLRDARAALEKTVALRPLRTETEGSIVETPADPDAAQYRLTGAVQGQPPYRGELVHAGWVATKVELPKYVGSPDSSRIVAPAEVEAK